MCCIFIMFSYSINGVLSYTINSVLNKFYVPFSLGRGITEVSQIPGGGRDVAALTADNNRLVSLGGIHSFSSLIQVSVWRHCLLYLYTVFVRVYRECRVFPLGSGGNLTCRLCTVCYVKGDHVDPMYSSTNLF